MSHPRSRHRRDAAALALSSMVPLLPATRHEWGQAMEAELAGIEPSGDRWRFTGGCVLAIIFRSAPGALASIAVPVGIVFATTLLTARTDYLPMHIGLIAMAAVLGVLYLTGDRAALFAALPTAPRLASAVRAGGALTLAAIVLGIVLSDRSGDGNVADRATTGLPIFTALIALYLVGFMSMTSAALVDDKVLVRGVSLGLAAAVTWLAFVTVQPPLPLSSGSAFAALTIATLAAAVMGAVHKEALVTALCTILVGALAIFALAHLALAYGPADWVPSDTAALTPAARLAQSRVEAGEGYLQVVLVGAIAALSIFAVAYRNYRRSQDLRTHRLAVTTNRL